MMSVFTSPPAAQAVLQWAETLDSVRCVRSLRRPATMSVQRFGGSACARGLDVAVDYGSPMACIPLVIGVKASHTRWLYSPMTPSSWHPVHRYLPPLLPQELAQLG